MSRKDNEIISGLPVLKPLYTLLSAYSPAKDRRRHRLLWAFDMRLADIVRTTTEPLLGQMRIAWWRDVIEGAAGAGDPLADALRPLSGDPAMQARLVAMVDGWEEMLGAFPLDDAALRAFGLGRGGGLFGGLAGASPDWMEAAGACWALWDLSGHVGDAATADGAVLLAKGFASAVEAVRWPRELAPLRIAFSLARRDVTRGRRAPAGMTPGLYVRLLGIALAGRQGIGSARMGGHL